MENIKIIQIGLGPIGRKIIQQIKTRQGIEIVGAVDINPELVGKDLGQVCNLDSELGIKISGSIAGAIKNNDKIDVAVLTTSSSFKACAIQVQEILKNNISVVSTCEEMAYPWKIEPELAKKVDETARKHGVSIIGTGVNPGFLMDYLPISLTAVCEKVDNIIVSRIQDASYRRIPFQQKIGAGLTLDEFEARKQTGSLRHVGLTESIHMIANALNWQLDKCEDILTPIIATQEIIIGYKKIKPGMAAGVQQIGRGCIKDKEVIKLIFRASAGEKDPKDMIEIKGIPDITSTIPGGVNGDIATCAITVNAIKPITKANAGLRVMTDIPSISYFTA